MTVREYVLSIIESDRRQYDFKRRYVTIQLPMGQVAYAIVAGLDDGFVCEQEIVITLAGHTFIPMPPALVKQVKEKERGSRCHTDQS